MTSSGNPPAWLVWGNFTVSTPFLEERSTHTRTMFGVTYEHDMGKVEPRSHVQKGGVCWRDVELFMLTPVLLATIVPSVLCGDMALSWKKTVDSPYLCLKTTPNHTTLQ